MRGRQGSPKPLPRLCVTCCQSSFFVFKFNLKQKTFFIKHPSSAEAVRLNCSHCPSPKGCVKSPRQAGSQPEAAHAARLSPPTLLVAHASDRPLLSLWFQDSSPVPGRLHSRESRQRLVEHPSVCDHQPPPAQHCQRGLQCLSAVCAWDRLLRGSQGETEVRRGLAPRFSQERAGKDVFPGSRVSLKTGP